MQIINNNNDAKDILKSDKYLQRFTVNNYLPDILCEWFIFEKKMYSEEQEAKNAKLEDSILLDNVESIWDFCSLDFFNDISSIIKKKYNIDNTDYKVEKALLSETGSLSTIDINVLNTTNSDFIVSLCLNDCDTTIAFSDGIVMNQNIGLLTIQSNKSQSKIYTMNDISYMLFIFISIHRK